MVFDIVGLSLSTILNIVCFGMFVFVFLMFLRGVDRSSDKVERYQKPIMIGMMIFFIIYQIFLFPNYQEAVDLKKAIDVFFSKGLYFYNFCESYVCHSYTPPIYAVVYGALNYIFPFLDVVYRYKIQTIIPNIIIVYFLYSQISGTRGMFAASFLLVNPGYNQYIANIPNLDSFNILIVMISFMFFEKKHLYIGSMLLASTILIRQYSLIFMLPVLLLIYFHNGFRTFLRNAMIMFVTVYMLSLPFLIVGGYNYIKVVFLNLIVRGGFIIPNPVRPTAFSDTTFSGFWSILNWLGHFSIIYIPNLFKFAVVVQIVLLAVFVIMFYSILSKRVRSYWEIGLLGMAVFIFCVPNNAAYMVMPILPLVMLIGFMRKIPKTLLTLSVLMPVVYRLAEYVVFFSGSQLFFLIGDIMLAGTSLGLILYYTVVGEMIDTKTNMLTNHV